MLNVNIHKAVILPVVYVSYFPSDSSWRYVKQCCMVFRCVKDINSNWFKKKVLRQIFTPESNYVGI